MTYDPVTLIDPRDDDAAYRLGNYNARGIEGDDIDAVAFDPDYSNPDARGVDRAATIAAAVDSGDWSAVEAWSGVHDENVHTLLDPTRRGESITYTTPAPSWYVATNSERKVSRGKKGTSTRITSRGRVVVVGDSHAIDDQTTRGGRVPRVVIAHAIDALRAGNRHGHVNGDALAALTSRLYDVPALLGSDHWSWSEATEEIPSSGAAVLAAQTCGISGGMVPILDAATGPEYRTRDDDPRWFPSSYPRKHYPRRHATRLRLSIPRRRKTDPAPRESVVLAPAGVPWRAWYHVAECVAPAADSAHMFHGYRRITRGATTRETRRAVVREAFLIDAASDPRDVLPTLAAVVRDDGAGRYAWRVANSDTAGLITIDKRARMSITGPGIEVRQCRTIDALRKQLATV